MKAVRFLLISAIVLYAGIMTYEYEKRLKYYKTLETENYQLNNEIFNLQYQLNVCRLMVRGN